MGRIPYLGKISLHWCDHCNLPLLSKNPCDICNEKGKKVNVTPPGDVRPAFWKEYILLRDAVNRDFGEKVGDLMFPPSKIVIINSIGGLDRTEEVIIDGFAIGIFIYDIIKKKFFFLPRIKGAQYIFYLQERLQIDGKRRIMVNADGLPYILKGKSILAPGVDINSISDDINKNDYCIITARNIENSENNNNSDNNNNSTNLDRLECISVGIARESSKEMLKMLKENYGALAKNNKHLKKFPEKNNIIRKSCLNNIPSNEKLEYFRTLDQEDFMEILLDLLKKAYDANYGYIKKKIQKATRFIEKTLKKINKQVAVAYSGGKDSLATLLLVWKVIGPNFKIFFANTGLELPEAVKNVEDISKVLGMENKLVIKNAGNTFWEIVESFGPPGRDYRFCCHSLKAQQITEVINTIYNGEKVLTFLGIRRYESQKRSETKSVYINSFIPKQIAATPIKNWNALTLWLYILFEPVYHPKTNKRIKIPITNLYFEGHERLGCYLCPAANLSSFKLIEKSHPLLHKKWFDFLKNYSEKHELPKEWVDLGLWRFKQLTPQWKNLVDELNIPISFVKADPSAPLQFALTKGFSPCLESGYSIKGKYSQPIDLEHLTNYIPALNKNFDFDDDLNVISIKSNFHKKNYRLNIFPDGSIFLLSPSKDFEYIKLLHLLTGTVFRSIYCNQCKTCISICPQNAISLNPSGNGVLIDSKCTSCTSCITHCPLYQISKKTIEKLN